MENGFWAGGQAEHAKDLKNQYERRLKILQDRLSEKDPATNEKIQVEIDKLTAEFQSKLETLSRNLY